MTKQKCTPSPSPSPPPAPLRCHLLIGPPASGKTKLSEFENVGLFLAWAI